MSSIVSPASPVPPDWRRQFTEMLPAIKTRAGEAFRHLAPEDRQQAVQELVARACCATARLAQLGKTSIASPAVLARYGVAQVNRSRKQK